ncbi:MAG TPA: hypothetical protein DIT07_01055 [Sphingobacteriaceae bacterium]|nr:hypothetical protein [Sphingobacteriaceae bacterium]
MAFRKTVKRAFEIAFSKHAQPLWFRILKYLVLICIAYVFWGRDVLWIIFISLFTVGLCLHFWYRHKTHAWTKSYALWKHDKDRTE